MFVICPNPAENDQHHGGMLASAKVTYVKGLEPSLPAECGVEPTDTQRRRDCLAEIIMKVLEKPLSVEETHAILEKARGFGRESKALAGEKPRDKARVSTRLLSGASKARPRECPAVYTAPWL